MLIKESAAIGAIVVDIQILRRAALSPAGDSQHIRSPEDRKRIQIAEARLTAMNGLELVQTLIEYTRATGVRLKI